MPNILTTDNLEVSREDWIASNEHETILQFVTRTSIRYDKSTNPVRFYVYEKSHADYLADYFSTLPHTTPIVTYVDLGIHDGTFHRGRIAKVYTPEEAVERAELKKAKRTAAQRKRRARAKAGGAV